MGAEVAVRRGIGTVVLDVRRGDGPPSAFDFTFIAIAATDTLATQSPGAAAAAVRAVAATQVALAERPERATEVGRRLFPPEEAEIIAELVRRDVPYYDPAIRPETVARMNSFARSMGILQGDVPFEHIVATHFSPL
jgi:ABC-type nitrate/sulfonate/bicarbonate transport system substrate-binding protein